MKNQGVWITRILSLIVCLFVFAYMGYHIFSAFNTPVKTVTTVLSTATEALPVSGIVVRDESVLLLPGGLIEFTVGEAERVSAQQTIAVAYSSESARLDNVILQEKIERRNLLSYIAGNSGGVIDASAIDADLRSRTASLLSDVSAGQLSSLSQKSLDIKALLFRQAYSFEGFSFLLPLIERLDEEIMLMSSAVSSASTVLAADKPGLFSPLTDGLEEVWTLGTLKTLDVSTFRTLSAKRSLSPSDNKGRLVNGWTWRFVCLMPAYQANTLKNSVTLRFGDYFSLQMKTERVSEKEDGVCAVVFSSDRYIDRVISERRLQGEVVYAEYEGVRVPAEGLRLDVETSGYYVYCLVLGRVVRKDVTLIQEVERDNYFLVEYHPDKNGTLLPGDEIILDGKVDGKPIYDGMVLES